MFLRIIPMHNPSMERKNALDTQSDQSESVNV